MMMRREAPTVKLDDRFVKAGDPLRRVWVVVRLLTTIDGILHVRMVDEGQGRGGGGGETRIISNATLTDRHFYSPAPLQ